jgi:GntR family transcriptional regulator
MICYSTQVIPFRVSFTPGVPIYEQVVYAATKAILSGQMAPGERFPSVRALSQELKINPNTAHKVVLELVSARLLEVHPGIGTIVAKRPSFPASQRASLLASEVEHLVVEANRLGLTLEDLMDGIVEHWHKLNLTATPARAKR